MTPAIVINQQYDLVIYNKYFEIDDKIKILKWLRKKENVCIDDVEYFAEWNTMLLLVF